LPIYAAFSRKKGYFFLHLYKVYDIF